MPDRLAALRGACQKEARRLAFPVDEAAYRAAGRDPGEPILYGGTLDSPLCFFGRDLGREEVEAGEPLIGSAGRMVRRGLCRHLGMAATSDEELQRAAGLVLLANTVPYKPPGNKPYGALVRERFRPYVAEVLVVHFTGRTIIPLGTEAFLWFAPYGEPGELEAFFRRVDRFTRTIEVKIRAGDAAKVVTLAPLPHPSPLNQRYYAVFPQLLERRLKDLKIDLRP
jgi:uracil-DNA glycosylase